MTFEVVAWSKIDDLHLDLQLDGRCRADGRHSQQPSTQHRPTGCLESDFKFHQRCNYEEPSERRQEHATRIKLRSISRNGPPRRGVVVGRLGR